jgi:hypothetical protein
VTAPLRVFVNGRPLDVPPASTALDAVRAADPAAGEAVAGGARIITDSRGLPIDPATRNAAGSIYRIVSARAARAARAADPADA